MRAKLWGISLVAPVVLLGCGEVKGDADAGPNDPDAMGSDGGGGGEAALEPDTGSHDFGTVLTGASSAEATFTITNSGESASGTLATEITGTDAGEFAITTDGCDGQTLAPQASCDVGVTFSPTTAGGLAATLSVDGDPGGTAEVSLQGTGAAPGALSVSPTSHPFGDVVVGSSSTAIVFTVTNTGDETSGSLTTDVTGTDAGEFSISNDTCEGNTVSGGSSCSLEITFSPSSAGSKAASLTVSGDPGGTAVSSLTGGALAPAVLEIDDTSHNFGGVVVNGTSTSKDFVITNGGDQTSGTLSVSKGGTNPGQFDITSDNCNGQTLDGGVSCTVTVVFNPTTSGSKSATLQVTATPGGSVQATLGGDGQDPADITGSPGGNNFGLIEVGQSAGSINWVVTNNGDVATGTISFTNSNAAEFPTTNGCSGTLAPGANCTVTVDFTPQSGGSKSSTLNVSASPGGSVDLNVNGQGGFRLTVTANGTGTVTSSAGGISCPGDCDEVYTAGTNLTVMARTTNGSSSFFAGWSGAGCSGPFRDCDIAMTQSRSVTATFRTMDSNLVFVSSKAVPTDLGSAKAYDTVCNDLATDAGINNAGGDGYIAMIGDSNSAGPSRLGNAFGWVRMDGRAFADTQADLFGENQVFYPARFDETGQALSSFTLVMTGSNADGSANTNQNCGDWTNTGGTTSPGRAGGGPELWITGGGSFLCNNPRPVLCMGVTRAQSVAPDRQAGKLIYISARQLIIGSQTPDEACNVVNPSGNPVKALIATTDAAAAAVLEKTASYVRPDGVLVGTGDEIIARGDLVAGPWQEGGGTYANQTVWTGQTTLTDKGTSTSTCANWTKTSPTAGRYGRSGIGASWFWAFNTQSCASDGWVYCVEE